MECTGIIFLPYRISMFLICIVFVYWALEPPFRSLVCLEKDRTKMVPSWLKTPTTLLWVMLVGQTRSPMRMPLWMLVYPLMTNRSTSTLKKVLLRHEFSLWRLSSFSTFHFCWHIHWDPSESLHALRDHSPNSFVYYILLFAFLPLKKDLWLCT